MTDGWTTTYSKREHEFTFAKNAEVSNVRFFMKLNFKINRRLCMFGTVVML